MNENEKYRPTINKKFRELSFPDMNETWPDMKAILDKKMPQKRKRRFLFWLNSFVVLAAVVSGILIEIKNDSKPSGDKTPNNNSLKLNTTPKPGAEETSEGKTNLYPSDDTTKINRQGTAESNHRIENSVITDLPNKKETNTLQVLKDIPVSKQPSNLESNEIKRNDATVDQTKFKTDANTSAEEKVKQNVEDLKTQVGAEAKIIKKEGSKIHDIKNEVPGPVNSNPKKNQLESTAKDSSLLKTLKPLQKDKRWVVGASLNYNLPVSSQEMSTVNMNGKRNSLTDFLPSLYVQYHFNRRWHIESSFQFSSPQYTSAHKLSSEFKVLDPDKKEENAVWLNKLYYLNVPFSIHFKPLPHLTIGTGIQYSYLKRSLFEDELAVWQNGSNGWEKISSTKSIQVKSNAAVKKEKSNNGNGNGNGNGNANGNGNGNGSGNGNGNGNNGSGNNGNGNNGNNGNGGNGNNGNGNNGNSGNGNTTRTAPLLTRIDSVAYTLRSSDWRMLFDINYSWRRLNVGCRFNFGLNSYINTKAGNFILPVRDRNQALQFYLRYDLLNKMKKK